VHGGCRQGIIDEALRLVKQMEGAGIRPNILVLHAGRAEDAVALFGKMKEKGVALSEATYRTLVHGVFKCLGRDRGYKMLSEWLGSDPALHSSACHTLLYCLSKNDMNKEAVELVKKLSSNGYVVDNASFRIVIAGAVKCLELSDLCELVDDLIKRTRDVEFDIYIMIIKSLLSCKDFTKVNRYLHQMVQDGLLSSVTSYNMVIDCLVKAGAMERERRLSRR
jgi:pentatricopeptide repeat protein